MSELTPESSEPEIAQNASPDFRSKRPKIFAIAAMTLASVCVLLFAIMVLVMNLWNPTLGDQSLVLPTLGMLLVSGTMIALVGLSAGIIDLWRSQKSRQMTFLTLLVNGAVCVFIFLIIMIGVANS